MAFELYYTSAPRGLRPGSSGFCTVAATAGTPPSVLALADRLSASLPPVAGGRDGAGDGAVAYSHWRVRSAPRPFSVLSRVSDAGLDYTQRPNRLAYHLVLDPSELAPAGPAWMVAQPGLMEASWSGEPRVLPPSGKTVPRGDGGVGGSGSGPDQGAAPQVAAPPPPAPPPHGQLRAFATTWANRLAESFLQDPTAPTYVVVPPAVAPVVLFDQAIRLLPAALRWQVTFSTWFSGVPVGLDCAWRCVPDGTAAADAARGRPAGATLLDLARDAAEALPASSAAATTIVTGPPEAAHS